MGDNENAALFATILWWLTDNLEQQPLSVQYDRRRLAAMLREHFNNCDFNDDDLCSYQELGKLGLAQLCTVCGGFYTDWNVDQHDGIICVT